MVGNFGGHQRFDYTAHGDAINTAARLEPANKMLGTNICIGRSTVELCTGFHFRPMGELLLKGKTEPVEVFEPIAETEAASAKTRSYLDAYRLMQQKGDGAADAFVDLAAQFPGDPLIEFHAQRLLASARERRHDYRVSDCTIKIGEKLNALHSPYWQHSP